MEKRERATAQSGNIEEPKGIVEEYVAVEHRGGDLFSPIVIGIEKTAVGGEVHIVNAILDIWCNSPEEAFDEGERHLRR